MAFPRTKDYRYIRGQPFHELCWGKVYPTTEPLVYDATIFHFYDTRGAIRQFLPTLFSPFMLLRREYEIAYEYLKNEERKAKEASFPKPLPKRVLTGQPGIGKTTFIIYVLLRRLQLEQQTVVLLDLNHFILFDADGVWSYPVTHQFAALLPAGVWVLAESSDSLNNPPRALLTQEMLVVQTTSPAPKRWKTWITKYQGSLYLMDVWEDKEIAALLTKLREVDDAYSVEEGLRFASEYGPNIRNVLRCIEPNFEVGHREVLSVAASTLVNSGANIFMQIQCLNFSDNSKPSILIFVRPRSLAKRYLHRLAIPTPGIARVLATAVLRAPGAQQQMFFMSMCWPSQPLTRAAAKWIFENLMHARLTLSDGFVPGYDHARQPCLIPTTTTIVPATQQELESYARDFYWRPGHGDYPGIDAVLRRNTEIWVFRSTISCRHGSVAEGLQEVGNRLGSHDIHGQPWRWHLVVIGSSREEAENWRAAQARKLRQSSESEWKEIDTYACELIFGPEDQSRADMFMSEEDPDFDVAAAEDVA